MEKTGGYFKMKIEAEGLGKKASKVLMKIFGWNTLPFETVTLSFKMNRKPSDREIEIMSDAVGKAGIDPTAIHAQWIKL